MPPAWADRNRSRPLARGFFLRRQRQQLETPCPFRVSRACWPFRCSPPWWRSSPHVWKAAVAPQAVGVAKHAKP